MPLDTVHACSSITQGGTDTYTVTTTADDDVLTIQLATAADAALTLRLTGPDDAVFRCVGGAGPTTCTTGPAGDYTLTVTDQYGSGAYTLAASSLRSSPCHAVTDADLAFGGTPLTGSLAAGAASACDAFGDSAAAGDVLRLGTLAQGLQGTMYDANATAVCYASSYVNACTLSGTAPYRMLVQSVYAQAVTYSLAVNRLSHPSGCTTLAPAPFGDPGSGAASGTVPVGGVTCRAVALPAGPAQVSLQGGASTSGAASWQLYTADGTPVCQGSDDATCDSLPGAGTYSLLVDDVSPYEDASYAIALVPLTSTTGCAAAVGTAYDLPPLHGDLASPVQVDCQAFDATAGDRIDLTASPDVYAELSAVIVDPSGAPSCSRDTADGSSQDGCVLTGTGPYRVVTHSLYAFTGTYSMRIGGLSHPAGCTALSPQAYGTAPVPSTDPCWLLQVPAAGAYDVGGTGVYREDGTRFCAQGAALCTFPAAGTYAMVFRPGYVDDGTFTPVFVSPAQTAGCAAGSDTGFATGALRVDLSAAGVRDCLTLPTASGNGLYLAASYSDAGYVPDETVYDAAGVQQCENTYAFHVCKLTGTAPFHMVLTAPRPAVYGLTVQRTGDSAGCAAWPLSAFGGSTGTAVTLTAVRQTACLALPASGHSTAEMFDFTNTANKVNASVQVFDAAGDQVCATIGSSTTTCRFTAGAGYTAVLVGVGTADTYHLVHRDVSSTASCAAPASLTVGSAATDYTFTSALDSRCLRVKAATTDKLWLSVRTPAAAANTGADLLVVDSSGAIVCWQYGASCRVSGSADYVVAVLASNYAGTPIAAHVDTWRVGTASGWVSQCTANSLPADGFGPRTGSLTQTSAALCGVMQVKQHQLWNVYLATGDPAHVPALGIYDGNAWNGSGYDFHYQCMESSPGFRYQCSGSTSAAQVLFLLSPGDTALPVPYTLQGVCTSQCATGPKTADVTALSPASGPAESDNQVVVHGTNLTLGTTVDLRKNGLSVIDYPMSYPVSVSADGTSLTVRLATYGVPPGRYDVVLDDTGYQVGTRSPGYLPGGYTVTKAPIKKGGGPAAITEPAWMAAFLKNRPHRTVTYHR
ncbi:hypothetical protein [Actinacidiphila rubida]|uniref:hypothetical protein n=1 Tax=Actinacidiphila rubida TaxID=310780 RepID=UPI00114CF558|nr:hypothetical protein [Actinacidiphila rubida]